MSQLMKKMFGSEPSGQKRDIFKINAFSASRIFGEQIFSEYFYLKDEILHSIGVMYKNRLRETSIQRPDSGSISLGAAVSLVLASIVARPRRVAEVGTYIGCSAASIAIGGIIAGTLESLDTCDINPAIKNPLVDVDRADSIRVNVHQCKSEEMFSALKGRGDKIDFLHVDGRISPKDIDILKKILTEDCVIILDDCESDEKGHVNLDFLRQSGLIDNHFFIQPFEPEIFSKWGIHSRSTTGFLLPVSSIALRRQ
jgi:predicted O-methyltransferase YrrM